MNKKMQIMEKWNRRRKSKITKKKKLWINIGLMKQKNTKKKIKKEQKKAAEKKKMGTEEEKS